MTVRSRAGRLAAVTLGASIGLLGLALPAYADDGGSNGHDQGTTSTATLDFHEDVDGLAVNLSGNRNWEPTTLFGLKGPDGELLHTYCIELNTLIADDGTAMQEVGWDEYPNSDNDFNTNRKHINWILQNSYPEVSLDTLSKLPDLAGLKKQEAIAGTQAAIWHYSDGVDLQQNPVADPDAPAEADDLVTALYQYLTGDKNTGAENEPGASLSLSPATVSGHAGDLVGPVTVHTTAKPGSPMSLKGQLPDGVTLTDANGNAIDASSLKDGSKIFFNVPTGADAGDGSVTVSVTTPVQVGRLFIGLHYKKHPSQSLIVASSGPVERKAMAKASWTVAPPTTTTTVPPTTSTTTPTSGAVVPPSPTSAATTSPAPEVNNTAKKGGLAYTGVAIGVPVGIGVLLLLGGGALLLIQRKRRRA